MTLRNLRKMLKKSGAAFGAFQNMLSDYPAETLHEVIPHFHDAPARFEQLMQAVRENKAGRLKNVAAELEICKGTRNGLRAFDEPA